MHIEERPTNLVLVIETNKSLLCRSYITCFFGFSSTGIFPQMFEGQFLSVYDVTLKSNSRKFQILTFFNPFILYTFDKF